jgi:diaminohydroxyphosphoribosylaminopyrimidine deaminase/5-amino-6-(5-phosphoribosylamino)uracil reductase
MALTQAGAKARGGTAYVTLEPCCHTGKTPPCDQALIAAGVAEVVVAMRDPNAMVNGRGLARLRKAGMKVRLGPASDAAAQLNAPYLKLVRRQQPWVMLKWAQSLDGKIAAVDGSSQWITGPQARRHAHRLRGRVDAIVVGIGTALADDPMLTCRSPVRPRRIATRIVLDSRLRLPPRSQLVRTAQQVPTIVATTRSATRRSPDQARRLARAGCELWPLPSRKGRVDLQALLRNMGRAHMTNILVEGGGRVLGAFWDDHLADEAYVFVAPRLIGGLSARGPLEGAGPRSLDNASPVQLIESCRLGPDRLFHLHADSSD